MTDLKTKYLGREVDAVAPDGFAVRLLVRDDRGGLAHFELSPGQTARAGVHRTVTEIWYVIAGRMWRRTKEHEDIVSLEPGAAVTMPVGTQFQSRAIGSEPLAALGVT